MEYLAKIVQSRVHPFVDQPLFIAYNRSKIMKQVIVTIVGAFFLTTVSHAPIQARHANKQPPVEVAHSSSSSSSSSRNLCCQECAVALGVASAHTDSSIFGTQAISVTNTATPILFAENVIPHKGIAHPVSGNSASFKVGKSGMYIIEWHMSLQTVNASGTSQATIQLFNLLTNTTIDSSELNAQFPDNNPRSLAGQTLVRLIAGTTVQLQATVTQLSSGVFLIIDPTISFIRIAD